MAMITFGLIVIWLLLGVKSYENAKEIGEYKL